MVIQGYRDIFQQLARATTCDANCDHKIGNVYNAIENRDQQLFLSPSGRR